MKQKVIREFTLWTVCWIAGTIILATEVAVKARRPVNTGASALTAQPASIPAPLPVIEPVATVSAPPPPAPAEIPEEKVTGLLVDSVIQIESAGNPRKVGSRGERGLMQIKNGTWSDVTKRRFGRSIAFSRAFEPTLNREIGTAYLAELHKFVQDNRAHWQSDERSLLLACYNAGPGRVAEARFNLRRLPASTRDYVSRASALHDLYLEEHALKLTNVGKFAMQIVPVPAQTARDS